jgi:hypothetical protein
VCGSLVPDYPNNFDPAAALQSGIFEVMNKTTVSASVLAYAGTRGSNVYLGTPSPIWGIEGVWPGSNLSPTENRYLVYGWGTPTSTGGSFELGTLPTSVDTPALVGGLTVAECIKPYVSSSQVHLFKHLNEVLNLRQVTFCYQHITSTASSLEKFGRRLAALISPNAAYASDAFDGSGGGSGWSPFDLGTFTGTDVSLTFDSANPTNAFTGTPLTIVVDASTISPPMPSVLVDLTITGNNGTPTGFYKCDTATGPCDTSKLIFLLESPVDPATGKATFYFEFAKAGGTDLQAVGTIGGTTVQTNAAQAAKINVQNK